MDLKKDYYAILGVLPTAEDIVIRAAYRALAQRYHPDRFAGTKDEATRRMVEINEAYELLSDPIRRREYDNKRGSETQSGDAYFDESSSEAPAGSDPLETDWGVALKYYQDLRDLEARLAKMSWRLAYSFRANMLEAKAFAQREQIATAMERQFLEIYFGTNPSIVGFARHLVMNGHRAAAKALNKTVRVLGAGTDADLVIKEIQREFGLFQIKVRVPAEKLTEIRMLIDYVSRHPNDPAGDMKGRLVEILGGKLDIYYGFWSRSSRLMFDGVERKFANDQELGQWITRELIPRVELPS